MRVADAGAWFNDYLSAFAALGRGELDDPRLLLDYYAVPLLLTTDDAALALTTEDDVVDAVRRQIAGLRMPDTTAAKRSGPSCPCSMQALRCTPLNSRGGEPTAARSGVSPRPT
jgi:hypothetical protein